MRKGVRDPVVAALLAQAGAGVGPEALRARGGTLPGAVRRYFEFAAPGHPGPIRSVRVEHGGWFRTRPGARWMPVQGVEHFTVSEPGFVWDATVRAAPLFWIRGRDKLVNGRGNMRVRLLSLFTVADATGLEIDQGSRLRWIAESVWLPYAYLAESVRWEAVDGDSARVRLACDGLPVEALVRFSADGAMSSLHAERFRDLGRGSAVPSTWVGLYADYREFHGFRIPTSVSAVWELEDGPFEYARFRVTSAEYS